MFSSKFLLTTAVAALSLNASAVTCDLSEDAKSLPPATNALGTTVLTEMVKDNANQNVVMSGFSIQAALSMVYLGADGQTRQAMARLLGYDLKDKPEAVAKAWNEILKNLASRESEDITIRVANGLWVAQDLKLSSRYLGLTRENFNASVDNVNFKDPATKAAIDKWVQDSTNGMIQKLFDQLPGHTRFVLANAIYFKGAWATAFDKKFTRPAKFSLPDGSQKEVSMMSRRGRYNYFESKDVQVVNMPYKGDKLDMVVVLPKSKASLTETLSLKSDQLTSLLNAGRNREGTVEIPKFKAEFKQEMRDMLAKLGIGDAFSDSANFSRMSPDEALKIDQVIHRAVIEVSEEGTEAAAVTGVGMVRAVSMPEPPFQFTADRPFLFFLRDRDTGMVLFAGLLQQP